MLISAKIRHYAGYLSEAHALLTDKLVAKAFVRSVIPDPAELGIPEVIRVLHGPEDVRPADIVASVMLKSAHASKWNILGGTHVTVAAARRKLRDWHVRAFSAKDLNERHYSLIRPRFFVERIVDDATGPRGEAVCYMVRCVRGTPVCLSAMLRSKQNRYDMASGECVERQTSEFADPEPGLVARLLDLARRLSDGLEFVRVDFYAGRGGRVWFSEMTFTPAAGRQVFREDEELRQGRLW